MPKNTFVSVIAPCRNEKDYIKKFLDSMVAQTYPKDHLEFLIADGASGDGTRDIILEYVKKHPFIHLINNPKKYTPFGLNLAIKQSKGDVILRLDSHAMYPEDYVTKCVQYLQESAADNVGGIIKTTPAKNTLEAKAIALCMSHGFSVGNSYFRKGADKPKEVDTVFGGCYKKEVFKKIGLFNEKLTRSQDLEFNLRLKRTGGKIMLNPDIFCYYYHKTTFASFFLHNFRDGQWAILPLKFTGKFFKLRHYLPLMLVLTFLLLLVLSFFSKLIFMVWIVLIGLYLFLILFFSAVVSRKENDVRLFFVMPVAFLVRTIGYSLGSLEGLTELLISARVKDRHT